MSQPATIGSMVRGLWWLVLIRGILLVLLGIAALVWPVVTVLAITLVFGIYAIADGITMIIGSVSNRKTFADWGWLLAQGIITTLAGIFILVFTGTSAVIGTFVLLWFLVFSMLIGGVSEIVVSSRLSGADKGWGITAGIIDLLLGILVAVLVMTEPLGAAAAFIWVLAIAAIVFGIFLIIVSFQVRKGTFTLADALDD